jgi:hypothetical protein
MVFQRQRYRIGQTEAAEERPASGSIPREFSGVPVPSPLHEAVIHTDLNDRVPPGAGDGVVLAAGASTL